MAARCLHHKACPNIPSLEVGIRVARRWRCHPAVASSFPWDRVDGAQDVILNGATFEDVKAEEDTDESLDTEEMHMHGDGM